MNYKSVFNGKVEEHSIEYQDFNNALATKASFIHGDFGDLTCHDIKIMKDGKLHVHDAAGFGCPTCGTPRSNESKIAETEHRFIEEDAGLWWLEVYECSSCSTVYGFANGT